MATAAFSSPSSTAAALTKLHSGEWAGWQCDFSPMNGKLKPVPDIYCSEVSK